MRALRSRRLVCLAVALLAVAPLFASAATLDTATAASPNADSWIGRAQVWLARLLPSWLTAASEATPPPAPAPPDGLELDDWTNNLCSDPGDPECTGGELAPDLEPNG